jgi:hypothetical protein
MNERKFGMALLVICGLFWWMTPAKHDPTQCDILPDSSALIDEVASVKESLTVQPDHIPEVAKMIDPQPSPSDKPHEKQKRKILVFLAPKGQKCPPCDQWKRVEMQRFMDANWEIAIFDQPHSYGRTPTFEIESGEKKVTRTGYTTLEQAAEAVR